jgi:leucyl aminopeptidase
VLQYLTAAADDDAIPLTPLRKADLGRWLEVENENACRWVAGNGFTADGGTTMTIPGADGGIERALVGLGENGGLWDWAGVPGRLPEGTYRVDGTLAPADAQGAGLGWALGTYTFARYRKVEAKYATLVWPDGCDRDGVEHAARATFLVRDLINTPASDMGPQELAAAAAALAGEHGADCRVITGDDLLEANYPAIHAVGRASARAPCLIDLTWGEADAPKVTLVGKGVCFDSGGLDLKAAGPMKLMKKDMGGAANVLGLAHMVMAAGLAVRLRVLIPAVENSVSGNAMRPLDVVPTRKKLTIEIGNTDAEGRVILADALAEAADEKPAVLIDFATLTGAARVALGTGLPALFCNNRRLAEGLLDGGGAVDDPLWRLPLWQPYRDLIDSKVADLTNSAEGGYGGAITAALFLEAFVEPGIPWAHIDLMAWNTTSKPGRPEGGEAAGMRAVFAHLSGLFKK